MRLTAEKVREIEARRKRETRGRRIKARLPRELYEAVATCARACGCGAEEWAWRATALAVAGKLAGVPICENELVATRKTSGTYWVRIAEGFDPTGGNLRRVLACATVQTLPRLRPAVATELQEGRDYVVSGEW